MYKSNKPTSTSVASGNQQQNGNGTEHLQHQLISTLTSQTTTTSVQSPTTTPFQPVTADTQTLQSTIIDKEQGDTSTTDSIGGGEEELEDEEDEYKKIQKVSNIHSAFKT